MSYIKAFIRVICIVSIAFPVKQVYSLCIVGRLLSPVQDGECFTSAKIQSVQQDKVKHSTQELV